MSTRDLFQGLREVLACRTPKGMADTGGRYRHAGVLLPLLEEAGSPKVLFTKRTQRVLHHKGQISFPGGKVDASDRSVEETALREAYEEIGLWNGHVDVLGRIDDAVTFASSFMVHPVVGIIPYPYDFSLNVREVERLILVPLEVFHPDHPEAIRHRLEFDDGRYEGPAYEYDGDVIWGATARVMKNLMDIIDDRFPHVYPIMSSCP